jgi:hypothetical protein
MRRPLGLPHDLRPERQRMSLDFLVSGRAPGFVPKRRPAGVIDWRSNRVVDRIVSEDGPSKVVFSPDAGWLTSTTYGPRCSTSSTRRAAGSSTG